MRVASRSVATSATANYTVWTPIVMTMAIRSHNCLLTSIFGEGNGGAVKVANNGTIVQKWRVAINIAKRISKLAAPPYLSLFLLTQTHQVNI